ARRRGRLARLRRARGRRGPQAPLLRTSAACPNDGIMRVLVVEDYAPLRRSLVQGLREAGYAVDAAEDGEAGLAHAVAATYDAVVLDLLLPKVDGLTVLRRLRDAGST